MKDLKKIEDLLRESRPPDTDLTKSRHHAWRRLIETQRRRRKPRMLFFLPPWAWALASLVFLLLCLLLMLWIK
ncbi:MAG: hypothetical protein ACE5I1_00280 [bacterium]